MKTIPRLLAFCVAAVMLASLCVALDAPAAWAATNACRVKNLDTGVTKRSLKEAVLAAYNGHRVTVRGTCHGTTRIGKNLTIIGVRAEGTGRPTLDADRKGRVLKIRPAARVTITDVRLREGKAENGGGVFNLGHLTLTGKTAIVKSTAKDRGGGVYNAGTLKLKDASSIADNGAELGGGVYNWYDSTLKLTDASSIHHNNAASDGGGAWGQPAYLYGSSSIRGNTAGRDGGGAWSVAILHGSSSIRGNTAGRDGGGVTDLRDPLRLQLDPWQHRRTRRRRGSPGGTPLRLQLDPPQHRRWKGRRGPERLASDDGALQFDPPQHRGGGRRGLQQLARGFGRRLLRRQRPRQHT